jgi:hypothetical protein
MGAESEVDRLAAIEGDVELRTLGAVAIEPAGIVYRDDVALLRRGAVAEFGVGVFEPIDQLDLFALLRARRRGDGEQG